MVSFPDGHEKKIFSIDSGLCAAISFRFSQDIGRILENIVYLHLRRLGQEIFFYKKSRECDFVIKENSKITQAIQVCYELNDPETKTRELNGLIEAMQAFKLKEGLILSMDEESQESITHDNHKYTITVKPVWRWLLSHQIQ